VTLSGDAKRKYQLQWIRQRRDEWINANGPCASCGSTQMLEVDHIDPASKELEPAGIWSRRAEVREAELAKCQVLCIDCHSKKTANEKTCIPPHGTRARYARKDAARCRCSDCRAASAAYERVRRMKFST
jgi:5-methylcytosine-specific restriction endonuclease McrA